MGDILKGIQYPVFAGAGAVIGCLLAALVALVGLWLPGAFTWLWVPPIAGTVIGLVLAAFVRD